MDNSQYTKLQEFIKNLYPYQVDIDKSQYPHFGFITFPVRSNKAPIPQGWTQLTDSYPFEEGQLYGGMPSPHFIVVDVDVKNNQPGLESFCRFITDVYLEDTIESNVRLKSIIESKSLIEPNVTTPSGGTHYYILLPDEETYKSLNKNYPQYPGLDIIIHGKSQVILGNQKLDNGEYIHHTMRCLPSPDDFTALANPRVTPTQQNASQVTKPTEKSDIKEFTEEDVRFLLTCISNQDYNTWRDVCFMLRGSSFYPDRWRDLFHEFSSTYDRYHPDETERLLNDIDNRYNTNAGAPLTISSLPFIARRHSPDKVDEINDIVNKEKSELKERFVLIENKTGDNKFYDLKIKQFRIKDTMMVELSPLLSSLEDKKPTVELLIKRGIIATATDTRYMPDKSFPFYTDKCGAKFVNLYDPAMLPVPIPLVQDIYQDYVFLHDHIKRITGDYADLFMSSIAYMATQPGKKIRYMQVLQGGEGIGKGLVLHAIANHVLGKQNVSFIGGSAFEDKNNSVLIGKQLIVIEELIIDFKNAKKTMNDMKTLITEDETMCVEKYKTTSVVPNITSYIALTNHKDCLKKAGRRRFHAIISPIQDAKQLENITGIPTSEYHARLARVADENNPLGGVLREFFLTYPISPGFSPHVRPVVSDFDKIEAENLTKDTKWESLISLIRLVYETEILPDYIDGDLLMRHSKDIDPETDEPFFTEAMPFRLTDLRRFGRDKEYSYYYHCLCAKRFTKEQNHSNLFSIKKKGNYITKETLKLINNNLL